MMDFIDSRWENDEFSQVNSLQLHSYTKQSAQCRILAFLSLSRRLGFFRCMGHLDRNMNNIVVIHKNVNVQIMYCYLCVSLS